MYVPALVALKTPAVQNNVLVFYKSHITKMKIVKNVLLVSGGSKRGAKDAPPHRGNPGSATGYFTNQITKIKIVKNVLLLVYAL